jgi:hydrogenase-4 transcriptional activator
LVLAARLVRRGFFNDALSALAGGTRTSERLVHAELLQLTGRNAAAGEIVRDLLASPGLPARVRARALEIGGAVAADRGDLPGAVERFLASARAADDGDLREQACRARLRLVPALSDTRGPGAVASLLYELKPLVLRSGDPHLLAVLHLRFGQVEAKRGLPDRALKHLELARKALATEPNTFIEGLLDLDASVVASMVPGTAHAGDLASRALRSGQRSGHVRTAVAARANLCAIALRRGDLAEAERWAGAALADATSFPLIRAALLDTCVSIELARGRHERARALLQQVLESAAAPDGTSTSWFHLASRATWLECLEAGEDWPEALRVVSGATRLADSRGDASHGAWFRLRQAALSLSMHDVPAAERLLAGVLIDSPEIPVHALPELHAALARAFERLGDPAGAAAHARHARRVLADAGSPFRRQRIAAATASLLPAGDGEREPPPAMPAQAALHAATTLVQYAATPELLGREALGLLEALRSARVAAVVVREVGAPARVACSLNETDEAGESHAESTAPSLVIPLGPSGPRVCELRVTPAPGLAAAVACHAVRRAVALASELHAARRDAKERVSLWADLDPDAAHAGASPTAMQGLLAMVERVADAPVPVLITGETGAGKEVIARELHKRSARAQAVFLAFNCTSVPRDMLESQLFGHRRGAFTGAADNFLGLVRAAGGGTLFIDEVGEMSLESQPKLLRFLESGEVHPLGETRPVTVDVRVVAATNARLEHLVAEGRFREDLYYRLNVVRLQVPPLRERREEIPRLAALFLDRYAAEMRKGPLALAEATLERLLLYAWPGNIRQLQNEIRRIVALAPPGATIAPGMLAEEIAAGRAPRTPASAAAGDAIVVPLRQSLEAATAALERAMIDAALARTGGHLDDAARLLGISRKGLFLKRKRLERTTRDGGG